MRNQRWLDFPLYDADGPLAAIDLSQNTNQFGTNPALVECNDLSADRMYPSLYSDELKVALANYVGINAKNISTGCGSYDVLDATLRALTIPGDTFSMFQPGLVTAQLIAQMNRLEVQTFNFKPNYEPDFDLLLNKCPTVVYLCAPNNPTGTIIARSDLQRFLGETPSMVIVDEAYIEFANESVCDLVEKYENLIVLRTLSKAFGLAGLRAGYAIATIPIAGQIERSRGIFKLGASAEAVAIAATTTFVPWMREKVQLAVDARRYLTVELEKLKLFPIESAGNFVLVPIPNAVERAEQMFSQGVSVRPLAQLPSIGDALRITVGPINIMDRVMNLLRESLS